MRKVLFMADENIRETTYKPPAISIIVPVYNAELFLERCLGSLLGQTLKDIEIICIDDKSSDGSLKILREYEKKDSRIKVVAQEKNSGVAVARNTGLAVAAGEYIGFVDSDDFVVLDFYEKLYDRATSTDADIVKGEARVVDYGGKEAPFGPSFADIKKNRANFVYTFWSAIYRHDFLTKNKLDFPVGVIVAQDTVFLAKAVILANKIELVEDVYYCYVRQASSLDSDALSVEKLKSNVESNGIIVDFINNEAVDDKDAYNIVFIERLKYQFRSQYKRSRTFEGCLIAIRGAIELYEKCKYKDSLDKKLGENQVRFLSEGNEVALFADLLERSNKVVCLKLFNCIPLLKIIHRYDTIEMILFRWIPLLRIEKRYEGNYYYLFFCLPVMKKETKK